MVISTTRASSGPTFGDERPPSASAQPELFEPGQEPLSPNRNLAPISARIDLLGRLEVGGCALSDLADTWGTPL